MINEEKNNQNSPPSEQEIIHAEDAYISEMNNLTPGTIDHNDIRATLQRADNMILLFDELRKRALRITNIHDWCSIGGQPYLTSSGAQKVASLFGVSVENAKFEEPEYGEDENGKYIEYCIMGTISWQGKKMINIGTGSTRDKFFGYRDQKWLPVEDIDKNNLRKKAFTNFLTRAIKNVCGLTFTWDEIAEFSKNKISQDKVASVNFDKGKSGGKREQDTKEITEKRSKLREMILFICNDNKTIARKYLKEKTAFGDFAGTELVEKLSQKQIGFLFPKIENEYNEMMNDFEGKKQ